MEEHEPASLVGTTMRRIQRALTRSGTSYSASGRQHWSSRSSGAPDASTRYSVWTDDRSGIWSWPGASLPTPSISGRGDEKVAGHEPWFGPKKVGVGWGPRTWQGWLIVGLLTAVVIGITIFGAAQSNR
jgi:hypothetical protein